MPRRFLDSVADLMAAFGGQPRTAPDDELSRRANAETAKLQADIIVAELTTKKIEIEIKKLEREVRLGWIGTVAPHVTVVTALLVALSSIITIAVNSCAERRRLETAAFARVVENFASAASAVRAGAAVQLGETLAGDDSAKRAFAKTLLLSAAGIENNFGVRHAIEEALTMGGSAIVPELRARVEELVRETRIVFGRGYMPDCAALREVLPRARTLQEGIVLLARVRARITNEAVDLRGMPFRCAMLLSLNAAVYDFTNAILWQADLNEANLRGANLTNAHLEDADLGDADIAEAKFCRDKDTGLTLKAIMAARNWDKAYFPKDIATALKKETGIEPRLCS